VIEQYHDIIRQAEFEAGIENLRVRQKLEEKQKPWDNENRSYHDYYVTFRPVLGYTEIPDILTKLKKNHPNEKIVAMDICGTGNVYNTLPDNARPDIVIAMTLVDYRNEKEKERDRKKNIHVIEGNVALPETWTKFEQLCNELGISTVHLAIARPLGGIHTIPAQHLWFLGRIAQRVYKHLSRHGGTFLTETPGNQRENVKEWVDEAQSNGNDVKQGLIHDDPQFHVIRRCVQIIRHEDSPDKLSQFVP